MNVEQEQRWQAGFSKGGGVSPSLARSRSHSAAPPDDARRSPARLRSPFKASPPHSSSWVCRTASSACSCSCEVLLRLCFVLLFIFFVSSLNSYWLRLTTFDAFLMEFRGNDLGSRASCALFPLSLIFCVLVHFVSGEWCVRVGWNLWYWLCFFFSSFVLYFVLYCFYFPGYEVVVIIRRIGICCSVYGLRGSTSSFVFVSLLDP